MIIDAICMIFIAAGLFFSIGTALGVLRFPDFYTRMHAAGMGDTLSTVLILSAFALYHLSDFSWPRLLVAGKILFIAAFIFLTSPTTTHALMHAGHVDGIKHWRKPRDKRKDRG